MTHENTDHNLDLIQAYKEALTQPLRQATVPDIDADGYVCGVKIGESGTRLLSDTQNTQ